MEREIVPIFNIFQKFAGALANPKKRLREAQEDVELGKDLRIRKIFTIHDNNAPQI